MRVNILHNRRYTLLRRPLELSRELQRARRRRNAATHWLRTGTVKEGRSSPAILSVLLPVEDQMSSPETPSPPAVTRPKSQDPQRRAAGVGGGAVASDRRRVAELASDRKGRRTRPSGGIRGGREASAMQEGEERRPIRLGSRISEQSFESWKEAVAGIPKLSIPTLCSPSTLCDASEQRLSKAELRSPSSSSRRMPEAQ